MEQEAIQAPMPKQEQEKKVEETIKKDDKNKPEEKKKKPGKKKPEIKKKHKAIVNAKDLHISTKHSIAICSLIRGKKIGQAISELEKVISKKKAVPMKGEIPHRKGMGAKGGRYPEKACEVFVKLLRSLAANSIVNNMEEVYIFKAIANIAARPHRRFGSMRFKRTNVYLEAKEIKSEKKEEVKEKK